MKALARAAADRRESLPFRFSTGLVMPRGSLVVLLAAPGVGKSFLALNWAWDLVKAGLPVLYHTPDTDLKTQAARLVALMSNTEIDKVDLDGAAKLLGDMTLAMRWSEVGVSAETLEDLLVAETEFLGEAPALTIVDVVQDLIKDDSPEAYQSAFNSLHHTARKFGTTVLAVHHVNRGSAAGDGRTMPKLSEGRYGGEQRAYIELGLCAPNPLTLNLGVLKNRGGRAGYTTSLPFHAERGSVG